MAFNTRKDFTGITDQYLDTSAYNIDPNFTTIFLQDPKEQDQRRLRAYKYFMDFYRSRQWEEDGEFNPAYGNKSFYEQEFNRRTHNISRNIVDKLVTFCAKEPWTTKLPEALEESDMEQGLESMSSGQPGGDSSGGGPPTDPAAPNQMEPSVPTLKMGQDDPSNGAMDDPNYDSPGNSPTPKQERHPIHDLLEGVWEANDKEAFTYELFQMGMITGDVFVKMSYDEDFYAEGMGEIRLTVLDSRTVQPFFDDLDRKTLVGARIQYPVNELQDDGEVRKRMYREVHTDGNIVYMLDDQITDVVPNPLGEMLVIHIKNEPLPFERYGRSVLYDLIVPQKEYNEKISDFSEILAYHAAPVTIIKGARVQNLEKGARKVWGGIPADGDVYNLNLDADLSSSLEYLTRLKQHIHETGSVPEDVLSSLQEVSNTSGASQHLQYQPIVDRVGRIQVDYAVGLKKLNRLILRFYEAVGVLELPEDVAPALKYKTSIVWGDALPRDRSIDLADISTEIGLGIESKKGALKRLGEENPEAKLEEIKAEMMEQAEMDFMMAGLGGFGDPMAGPDGMGGTATGANDGTQNDVSGAVDAAKTNPNTQGSQTSVQAVKKSAQETTGANKKR